MSRIGKMPIVIPPQTEVNFDQQKITVVGPKGQLEFSLPEGVSLGKENDRLLVEQKVISSKSKALHGLARAIIFNMVKGVNEGFKKELELSGVGYRAQTEAGALSLNIGFSHSVKVEAPLGINFKVVENRIIIEGIDKQLVGKVASQIRALKPPEPYKGKGIKYVGEKIRRKAGKAVKAIGGAK